LIQCCQIDPIEPEAPAAPRVPLVPRAELEGTPTSEIGAGAVWVDGRRNPAPPKGW